jgi:hypothetical protein
VRRASTCPSASRRAELSRPYARALLVAKLEADGNRPGCSLSVQQSGSADCACASRPSPRGLSGLALVEQQEAFQDRSSGPGRGADGLGIQTNRI